MDSLRRIKNQHPAPSWSISEYKWYSVNPRVHDTLWAVWNSVVDYWADTVASINTLADLANEWIDYVTWNKDKSWRNYSANNEAKIYNTANKAKDNYVNYNNPEAQRYWSVSKVVMDAADYADDLASWVWAVTLLPKLTRSWAKYVKKIPTVLKWLWRFKF